MASFLIIQDMNNLAAPSKIKPSTDLLYFVHLYIFSIMYLKVEFLFKVFTVDHLCNIAFSPAPPTYKI